MRAWGLDARGFAVNPFSGTRGQSIIVLSSSAHSDNMDGICVTAW